MKLLKSKLAALVVALTFAGTAGAATIVTTPSLITGEGTFENLAISSGTFIDFIQFSVGPNVGSVWDASGYSAKVNGKSVGLTSFTSALYQGTYDASNFASNSTGHLVLAGTSLNLPTLKLRATGGETSQLDSVSYTLRLSGVTSGPGSYNGSITVSPVPEPGEWALMMSGLGLIGFMVRRRTSSGS